jgi:hypothetical protein
MSHGSRPHLSVWEGSRAATCPTAPNFTSIQGRALMLPRVQRHRTPPPYWGEGSSVATCSTILYGPRNVGIKKGIPACSQGALMWFQDMHVRAIEACCQPKPTDGHRQATREPGGPEPLSANPAVRTCPEVEVHWACHLTYTWS